MHCNNPKLLLPFRSIKSSTYFNLRSTFPCFNKFHRRQTEHYVIRRFRTSSTIPNVAVDSKMEMKCSSNMRERSVLVQYKPRNGDGGWYLVSLSLLHGPKLRIHYESSCVTKSDEELALTDFTTVEDLCANFRYPFTQLKDNECGKVIPGWHIVASYSPAQHGGSVEDDGYKYFDARLEKMNWSKHIRVNGEDNCMCTFEIRWMGGPNVGKSDNIHCENIYLLSFGSIATHPLFKAVGKVFKGKICKDLRDQIVGPSNENHSCNSVFPSLVGYDDSTNAEKLVSDNTNVEKRVLVEKRVSKDRLVIVEDKNGFLVCSIQKVIE